MMRERAVRNKTFHSDLIRSWKTYCDYSSFDGLHYVGGTHQRSKTVRTLFGFLFIFFQLYLMYISYANIILYQQYAKLTVITYATRSSLPFPAITFCNPYFIRKSVAGVDDVALRISAMALSNEIEQTNLIYEENRKACRNTIPTNKTIDSLASSLMSDIDFTELFRLIGIDSKMSAVKCWWNSEDINCSRSFANHYFESNFCFTFNQDASFLDVGDTFTSYGLDTGSNPERIIRNPGQNTFEVLLNPRQDEYCISAFPKTRNGAGFHAIIHDGQSLPSTELHSYVDISPGFEYTITLRPTIFDSRNFSEWLGNCNSSAYNFMNPESNRYSQETCLDLCMVNVVFKRCNCLLVPNNSTVINERTAAYFGIPLTLLKVCKLVDNGLPKDAACLKKSVNDFFTNSIGITCPECLKSCLETVYDYQITSRKFSNLMMKSLISDAYNSTESVRNNFILAKFKFQSMQEITVREMQAFTPINLFINVGNNMGLFLGMSMITLYEIVHQIALSVYIIRLKLLLNRKRRRTGKVSNIVRSTGKNANRRRRVIEIIYPSSPLSIQRNGWINERISKQNSVIK